MFIIVIMYEGGPLSRTPRTSTFPVVAFLEQVPGRAFFFPAEDPEALAEAMTAAYNGFDAQYDAVMQERGRAQFPERQRKFGQAYAAIVKRVSDHHNSTL